MGKVVISHVLWAFIAAYCLSNGHNNQAIKLPGSYLLGTLAFYYTYRNIATKHCNNRSQLTKVYEIND